MITGANGGLGKDAARQLALVKTTEKIYLACRNEAKAIEAKNDLEKTTGRKIFEILIMDVSSVNSVKAAVASLNEPVDALIMNAGGMGGKTPEKITPEGVTNMFAANVLGHVVLVDKLIEENKLNNVAMYASSEAVRGVKKMGMKAPVMKTSSEDEFAKVIDGSYFEKFNGMQVYGYVKYVATLWMSSMARKHPNIRFISMSPGATGGTAVMNDLKGLERIMFKYIGFPILMPLMGMSHKLDKGAARYVKAVNDETLTSGLFYASAKNSLVGPVMDQGPFMAELGNMEFQDNANNAIHRFIR
jgi:NAD(P)-dependent dehydrogenase (short-subunit alcohol dehydrogenase family)